MTIFTNEVEIFVFVLIGIAAFIISFFKFVIAVRNKNIWILNFPELITFCYIVLFVYLWVSPTYSFQSLFNF